MILVTGGTGLVGSHLLAFLTKNNKKVRAIYRDENKIVLVKKIFALYGETTLSQFEQIEWVQADITNIPALEDAFMGITRVYHCAALVNFNPAKYKLLKKINIEGTANIVNLCLAFNIEKLCYVSSVATLGSSQKGLPITEENHWNHNERNNVYAIAKYGGEMEVWRGTQEGLQAVIVNPGIILGISPDGDGSGVIMQLASRGIPFYPSGGMGVVDVRDVVRAMIAAMDSEIVTEQFILVGENITYKNLLSQFAILYGKDGPKKKLPKWIMMFLSTLDYMWSKLSGSSRKIVKATVRSMYTTSYYDSSKIKGALGFQFTPLAQTLERVVAYKREIK